jgi:hypothetical protein
MVVVEGQTDLTQIIPALGLLRLAAQVSEWRHEDRKQREDRHHNDQQRPQAESRSGCWPVCGRIRIRLLSAVGGVAFLAHVFSGVWFESRTAVATETVRVLARANLPILPALAQPFHIDRRCLWGGRQPASRKRSIFNAFQQLRHSDELLTQPHAGLTAHSWLVLLQVGWLYERAGGFTTDRAHRSAASRGQLVGRPSRDNFNSDSTIIDAWPNPIHL